VALCVVSIGSNVERARHVRGALAALRSRYGPLLVSAVYETPAVGFDGDPFYNLVVAFVTDEAPSAVAAALAAIERAHGRTREANRHAPRTLDLDLLLHGDTVLTEGALRLPRPEIPEYAFVLGPLAEILPDLRHPASERTYGELWAAFRGPRALTRVALDFNA
jgi:2-amino-4-hydroxy-6-hydroxymethyldihydropteridine diphosphokinase